MADAGLILVETGALRYLLAVPTAPAPGPRPLLCFLHGSDEGAPLEIHGALTRHGPLRDGAAAVARETFLVVAPQLPVAGDLWHLHADAVADIVGAVRGQHDGDAARCYLTGFSFGGNGVLDLALRQPDAWAALWAVDPTRPPARDPARPVWLSAGRIARGQRDGFVRALALRPAAAGADADGDRVWLDEGADHVGSATRAYRDARIYRWLLAQRLDAVP